jgi:CspA family cold shock protein
MQRGIIKFYSEHRGYGFISCERKAAISNSAPRDKVNELSYVDEVYVHYSQIKGMRSPQEGQRVTFDVRDGDRGLEAVNVKLVS